MALDVAITKQLGAFDLDAQFTAPDGLTALFGASGAGKSTIIKSIAGLVKPDAGHIKLGEYVLFDAQAKIHVPIHQRRIGMVFQDARLFPHMSVLKNLMYGARLSDRSVRRTDAEAMAELLGLSDLIKRKPHDLSGGEAQRVAIGRALLCKPKLLMLDEPLSGLDQARKADILSLIERVRDGVGVPILYVSHAREEVARLASHVVVIANGRCVDAGAPDAVLGSGQSASLARTVRGRLVAKNSADGLSELSLSGGRLFVPQLDAPLGSTMVIEIAARDVMLSVAPPQGLSALNVLTCTIVSIQPSRGEAAAMDVALLCGQDELVAQVTRRSVAVLGLAPGQPVCAVVKSVALAGSQSGLLDSVET